MPSRQSGEYVEEDAMIFHLQRNINFQLQEGKLLFKKITTNKIMFSILQTKKRIILLFVLSVRQSTVGNLGGTLIQVEILMSPDQDNRVV